MYKCRNYDARTEKIESWCFCVSLEMTSFELYNYKEETQQLFCISENFFLYFYLFNFLFWGFVKDCDERRRSQPLMCG